MKIPTGFFTSPRRPGDYLEFFAEVDLLGALSACPGGDTSSGHSDDTAKCYPLKVEVYEPKEAAVSWSKLESHGEFVGFYSV